MDREAYDGGLGMAETRASHFRCLFNRAHISGVLRYKWSAATGLMVFADELERKGSAACH
jgi:hypothetical protein